MAISDVLFLFLPLFEFQFSILADSLFHFLCLGLLFALLRVPGFDGVRCSMRSFPMVSFISSFLIISYLIIYDS